MNVLWNHGSDQEWIQEDGEEEVEKLVLVELSRIIDSVFLSKCENKCKIWGIDTESPIIQVGSCVLAGEHEDTLGTCVTFEANVEHGDTEGSNKIMLKYKRHAMKKLSMTSTLLEGSYAHHYTTNATSTLLTEKKEGEESLGGVKRLQIKGNGFCYRPNMTCSFLHENEDDNIGTLVSDKSLELEEQKIQRKDNSNLSYEQGNH